MEFVYHGAMADEVNEVLAGLVNAFCTHIGENLNGLYLHGSLAMGCFRPWSSDIDLLAVTHAPMQREEKLSLVRVVMAVAEAGEQFHKVEFSVVTAEDALRASHPIPYVLHYSDSWHQAYKEGRAEHVITGGLDDDLAAHFMVLRQRGVALYGVPVDQAIGQVSREDYLRAVWADIAGSASNVAERPAYTVLNLCRTIMYLQTGYVGSKKEGGMWAMEVPELTQFAPLIAEALGEYTSGQPGCYNVAQACILAGRMMELIRPLMNITLPPS